MNSDYKKIEIKEQDRVVSVVHVTQWEDFLKKNISASSSVIITDTKLFSIYGNRFSEYRSVLIPSGESLKSLKTVEYIVGKLIEMECDRDITIVGFGGGVVTDIAGFVASIYMRGVKFGFISTTLLGMVDASIGGKNGVNFDGFKNIVGTFTQPMFVVCDIEMIGSLPRKEVISGFAEIIKVALLFDKRFVEELYSLGIDAICSDREKMEDIVCRCIELKERIVSIDHKEKMERRKLNFGHTFGHAIEKTTNKYSHGEAVAIGMVFASKLSERKGYIDSNEYDYICKLILKFNLPLSYTDNHAWVINNVIQDKKRENNIVNFVLLNGIGDCLIEKITLEELKKQ